MRNYEKAYAELYNHFSGETAEIVMKKGQEILSKAIKNSILYNNKNKMKDGFTVSKLSDLAKDLKLPSSKGHKTKDYLELVINQVEASGYRFVQFLQLVDVLYVITEKVKVKQTPFQQHKPPERFRPDEEIRDHYNHPDPVINQQVKESTTPEVQRRSNVTDSSPELEKVKSRKHLEKSMKKNPLPWENNNS